MINAVALRRVDALLARADRAKARGALAYQLLYVLAAGEELEVAYGKKTRTEVRTTRRETRKRIGQGRRTTEGNTP